jgi:hypothetical protein
MWFSPFSFLFNYGTNYGFLFMGLSSPNGFRSYIYSRIFGLHYHPRLIYAYGLIVFSFKGILFGFWYSPLFLLIVFLLWDKTWLIILGAWKMNWAYFYWWQIIERLHFVSLWSLTPKTFCNIEHLGYVSELREDD